MRKKIIALAIILTLTLLSTPLVIGGQEKNEGGWKVISITGKCHSHGFSGFLDHFFCFWYTPHTLNLKMKEGCEVKVNGEVIPIDWRPDIELHGFIGRSIWPYGWTIMSKQEIYPPYDITVFGVTKNIDIL